MKSLEITQLLINKCIITMLSHHLDDERLIDC